MTQSISRKLYRQCLLLYPESFRCEFGNEMLGMFDECTAAQGLCRVLADVVFSALRQQISHRSTSRTAVRKSAAVYPEIAWSPALARLFAAIALGAVLITAVGERTPKASASWTIRPENPGWFPPGLLGRSCSDAAEPLTNRSASVLPHVVRKHRTQPGE